jgi:ABC-type lipoprotein export system ATPase subunit/HEPN domain-containing protein
MRDPKKNGIQQIRIRNFKVFKQPVTFNINGRHTLVYGANGSGKSSLYWALYTLLQSITKSPTETNKYFEYKGDESLLNIHEAENNSSYIFTSAKVNGVNQTALLSPKGVRVNKDLMNKLPYKKNWLREADLAAEFINHRQLIGFYNFANSEPINLIWAFENGFYPFLNGINHFKTISLNEVVKEIEAKLTQITIGSIKKKDELQNNEVQKLNDEYGLLVRFAQNNVNRFLHKNFNYKGLKVNLKPKGSYYIAKQEKEWVLIRPEIKLTVAQRKEDGSFHEVDRPQSFLNESLLTRVGVALRFALLQRRPQNLDLKLMIMDDLLISMDMDNRLEIINLIEKRYVSNYQLFIFTHDKALFNLLKRKIENQSNDWAIYEVNSGYFKNAKGELEKAKAFLHNGDLDACALELRKLAEILLREFLVGKKPAIFSTGKFKSLGFMLEEAFNVINQNSFSHFESAIIKEELTPAELVEVRADIWNEPNLLQRQDLTQEQKTKIIRVRKRIFDLAESIRVETSRALKVIKEVKEIKDRILNLGAHSTNEPLYHSEMKDAMDIFKRLKEALSLNS